MLTYNKVKFIFGPFWPLQWFCSCCLSAQTTKEAGAERLCERQLKQSHFKAYQKLQFHLFSSRPTPFSFSSCLCIVMEPYNSYNHKCSFVHYQLERTCIYFSRAFWNVNLHRFTYFSGLLSDLFVFMPPLIIKSLLVNGSTHICNGNLVQPSSDIFSLS